MKRRHWWQAETRIIRAYSKHYIRMQHKDFGIANNEAMEPLKIREKLWLAWPTSMENQLDVDRACYDPVFGHYGANVFTNLKPFRLKRNPWGAGHWSISTSYDELAKNHKNWTLPERNYKPEIRPTAEEIHAFMTIARAMGIGKGCYFGQEREDLPPIR